MPLLALQRLEHRPASAELRIDWQDGGAEKRFTVTLHGQTVERIDDCLGRFFEDLQRE